MKRYRALLTGLLIWAISLFGGPPDKAQAHAVLVTADPEPNAILRNPPSEVWILFSEPIEPAFSRVQVFDQTGQQVDNGDLKPANEEHTALVVTLPPLANGTYLVSWQVLSTVDGHTTSGTFPFGIGVRQLSAEAGSVSSTAQQPTLFSTGGRWLNLTGLVMLVGLFAFRLAVWRPLLVAIRLNQAERQLDRDFSRIGLKVGWLGLSLLGLGLVFTFISQASQYELFILNNFQAWLGTRFGSMWLLRLGLSLIVFLGLVHLSRRLNQNNSLSVNNLEWGAGLLLSCGLVLTTTLISHSAALTSEQASVALLADLFHLLSAGVWAGGLIQLGVVLWLARKLPDKSRLWLNWGLALNFSVVAASAVGLLLLSGGYLAWQHIGSWTALFGTLYGLTLLTKTGLAILTFTLAAINLLIIKPRLQATFDRAEGNPASIQQRFTRLVQLEALLALLVLVAAGFLTDLQRAQDAPLLANQPGRVELEQTADDLTIALLLEPALIGQNRFDIFLTGENGRLPPDSSRVSLRFTFLGQSMGTARAEAAFVEAGHYQVEGGYLSLVGPWQIEIAVRRPDKFDTFAAFRVEGGLSGTIRPVGEQSLAERLTRFLTRSGGSVTGLLLIILAIGWGFLASRAAKHEWQLVPLLVPGFIAFWLGGLQLYIFFSEFTPARFTTNPILPDTTSISRGEQLYMENCVMCHGPEGLGDGPLAINFSPPPADFTAGHTESHPDGDLYYWIKEGIPNTGMPAFGDQLSEEDLWHLVNYVRRLSAREP